jgi:hypothetical protein
MKSLRKKNKYFSFYLEKHIFCQMFKLCARESTSVCGLKLLVYEDLSY